MSFLYKARVENGVVTSIMIVQDNWEEPEDWTLITIDKITDCKVGDIWDGEKFSPSSGGTTDVQLAV